MAAALAQLYGGDEEKQKSRRNVGHGGSAPRVARWLGDIREFFPASVVQVIQKDAFERLGLKQMLLEPEFLAACRDIIPNSNQEFLNVTLRYVAADPVSLLAFAPQRRIAAVGRKFAKLGAEWHDLDRIDPQRTQFRRPAMFRQSVGQVELAVELATIGIT